MLTKKEGKRSGWQGNFAPVSGKFVQEITKHWTSIPIHTYIHDAYILYSKRILYTYT